MATRVEVSISWGASVVQTLSCCPPTTVRVGDAGSAVPETRLGGASLPLVVVSGGEVRLMVWPAATGTVTLPGSAPRRLDRFVASGDAPTCAEAPGMPTIPLPCGATAEIALSRGGSGASPYRAPASDDRLVFHVAVEEAPRPLRRRVAALRHAAAAGLALSVLAHLGVFATEPDPSLTPTEEEWRGGASPRDLVQRIDLALALREPDGDWDRIRPPLELIDDWSCADACWFSSVIGLPTPWYTPARTIGILAFTHPGTTQPGDGLTPRELEGCFAHPAREDPPRLQTHVTLGPGADLPRAVGDERPRRRLDLGELWGFLAVDDDGERPGGPALPLRSPRARRPRLAFDAAALEILTSSLDRASSAFEWCYRRAREDDPTLQGHVAMRLGAGASGGVEQSGTDVKNPELTCCLENAQRLWTARVRGAGELRYEIDLRP